MLPWIIWDKPWLMSGLPVSCLSIAGMLFPLLERPSPVPVSPSRNATCPTKPQMAKCLFHLIRMWRSCFSWDLSDFLHAPRQQPLKDSGIFRSPSIVFVYSCSIFNDALNSLSGAQSKYFSINEGLNKHLLTVPPEMNLARQLLSRLISEWE